VIRQHDAHLGRASSRIEDPGNVSDFAVINLVRIGIQADLAGVTQVHLTQVVFINIAQHPHLS